MEIKYLIPVVIVVIRSAILNTITVSDGGNRNGLRVVPEYLFYSYFLKFGGNYPQYHFTRRRRLFIGVY